MHSPQIAEKHIESTCSGSQEDIIPRDKTMPRQKASMAAKSHSINRIRSEAEVSQLFGTPFKLDEIVFSSVINNPSPISDHSIPPYLIPKKESEAQGLLHYLEYLSIIQLAMAHLFGARARGHDRNVNRGMSGLIHLRNKIVPWSRGPGSP